MEESDFNAYIANSSSESESDVEDKPSEKDKKTSRDKLRALLLDGNDEAMPEGWGDDGAVDEEEALDEDVDRDRHFQDRPKKSKKTDNQKDSSLRPEATAEELALLVASDNPNAEPKHFNIKSVIKAEKQRKRKKGRKAKGDVDTNETQEDFIMDVKDERFKALHDDHQFAIDPSNPQ